MEKILIVDDDKRVLEATQEALSVDGYETRTSESPEEAFRLIRANPNQFDLILLDWKFQRAVHGDMVLKLLKRLIPGFKTPVIFVTAHTPIVSKYAMRLGAFDTLLKPLKTEQLLDAVERALGKKPDENPHRKAPADMDWKEHKKLEAAYRITEAIVSTQTLAEAARALKCSVMTLNRWLRYTGLQSFVSSKERQSYRKDSR